MGREGTRKNSFTVSSVLKACGKIEDGGHCGRQVHANAIKLGLVSKNYVQSVLVGMYGRFGLVTDARRMFEINADGRNAACWSAMIAGYIRNGFSIEAIKILYEMNVAGLKPQESLLNEVMSACGSKSIESIGYLAIKEAHVLKEYTKAHPVRDVVCLKGIMNPSETVAKGIIQSTDPSTQVEGKNLGRISINPHPVLRFLFYDGKP
ncbi:hypothetical protein RJ639_037368 [Escallonia herrerae]|uniref:Pentatricopeptide repeat-containing protein n=1 Tax=Escallonia herrerae TaxID=1293975 RepID=A0AA88WSZ0_9ASTE|nr:hypothetical protein RJ639_037368 [Escallonia herrerae]